MEWEPVLDMLVWLLMKRIEPVSECIMDEELGITTGQLTVFLHALHHISNLPCR